MRIPSIRLTQRQIVLTALTAVLVVGALLFHCLLRPAFDRWRLLRSDLEARHRLYAGLSRNVGLQEQVDKEFGMLGPRAFQKESDHLTLSQFLRDLEEMARHPTLRLVNLKPTGVEDKSTHKVYRLQLTVAGKLQEIVRFVASVTHGQTIAGMETFSIRGTHGANMVECSLSLFMVRLVGPPVAAPSR